MIVVSHEADTITVAACAGECRLGGTTSFLENRTLGTGTSVHASATGFVLSVPFRCAYGLRIRFRQVCVWKKLRLWNRCRIAKETER